MAVMALLCVLASPAAGFTDDGAWQLRMMTAGAALDAGRLDEAKRQLDAALDAARTHGPDDARVIATLDGMAALAIRRGRPEAAIGLRRRALELVERKRGARHPDTALGLNALAQLLQSAGDLAAAEPLFRRALAIYRDALGARHVHVGTLSNNLAELLDAAGRHGEAERHYRRAVAIWAAELGRDHRYVATALARIATIRRNGAASPRR